MDRLNDSGRLRYCLPISPRGSQIIPGDEVQNKIEIALRQLLAFLGFDRSSFAEFDTDGRRNVLCSVAVKGRALSARSSAVVPELVCQGGPDGKNHLNAIGRGPSAGGDSRSGILSSVRYALHLRIPIRVGGHIVAGIGFASFTKRQAWVDSLIIRLKLLGEVFALALARKRAEENLAAALACKVDLGAEGRHRLAAWPSPSGRARVCQRVLSI